MIKDIFALIGLLVVACAALLSVCFMVMAYQTRRKPHLYRDEMQEGS